MKKHLFLVSVILLVPFMIGTGVWAADRVTIMGLVQPFALDENENPVAVMIESFNGPYVVVNNSRGKQLRQLVGKKVKAMGDIGEDRQGNATIRITSYEILLQRDEPDAHYR